MLLSLLRDEYVERAVTVGDFEFACLARLGVVDGNRDVAVAGVPEQLDVDVVALAAVEFADRRGDPTVVGSEDWVRIKLRWGSCGWRAPLSSPGREARTCLSLLMLTG
jgi:hypothetical protein